MTEEETAVETSAEDVAAELSEEDVAGLSEEAATDETLEEEAA